MNKLELLREELIRRGYGAALLCDEPLSRHTSFAIGGPADLLIVAKTPDELQALVRLGWAAEAPVLVIGSGTNILVADAGVRGLVLVNECRRFRLEPGPLLVAETGAPLREVARWSVEQALAGLEWAVGIPGTIGGAVVGNAGAYGGCIADTVHRVTVLGPDGRVTNLGAEAMQYGYRTSALKREPLDGRRSVVLEVAFRLQPGDAGELAAKVQQISEQRRARTPVGCCAGSIFKRTMQYPAGFLIEQAGLKGKRLGGAEVSPKHANFLMNAGGATAADVKALIDLVQREVWVAFEQKLEPEIEFVGEWT